jgi:ABC-type branched-subunit amino acid transport system substrate-binding protein
MKRFCVRGAASRARIAVTGAVAVAVVGTLAMGATAGPAGAASAATPGVTSTTITLGATEPMTGVAASYNDIAPAMNAVFLWANAHGGVNGRKINFEIKDDQYTPSLTATETHQLVLQSNIFADVGSLGTPTQLAVQGYLNSQKIPELFVLSGCNCWSNPRYPWTTGWEPPYTVDGKILGNYVAKSFKGQKIGFFTQDDEFGQDFLKGARMEIKSSAIVNSQTYTATTAAFVAGVNTQVAALQQSGAQVVMMASIPPFTNLFVNAAATLGYHPQLVIDGVSGDPGAIGSSAALTTPPPAAQAILNGAITNGWIPNEAQTTNPWVQVSKKLLADYDPSLLAKNGLTADELTGVAVGYTIVEALQAAGKNLTRQSLLNAIAAKGKSFVSPGFVPYSYSSGVHYGYEGDQLYKLSTTAPQIVLPGGSYMGLAPIGPVYVTSPGAGPVTVFHGHEPAVPSKLARTA